MSITTTEQLATPTGTFDTVILPETTLEATQVELSSAEMKSRIIALEAEAKAYQLRNKQEVIESANGSKKTVSTLSKEIKAELEEWHLIGESARRQREEIEAKNPTPYRTNEGNIEYRSQYASDKPLFPEAEDGEKLLGRQRFAAMSPQERAKVRDIRASDIARLNPSEYFGKGSSSRKASELGRTSPGLYAALKQRAIREGIF